MRKEDWERERRAEERLKNIIRAPRPKQRCQAFQDRTKYNRKRNERGLDDLSSFLGFSNIICVCQP